MEDCVDLKAESDEELDRQLGANQNTVTLANGMEVMTDDHSGWTVAFAGLCTRCHEFGCMLLHANECTSPFVKFVVCPKCQCLCTTRASFEAHVEACIGLTKSAIPDYKLHIVKFDESPCLILCEICGMYKQRKGALMDAHRYICQRYIQEHDGGKFPYMPGELKWTICNGAYTPPQYYHRLLGELKNGGKWSEIEARYFARSGVADCWRKTPCEAFRDLDNRAPVYPGAAMIYEAPGDDDDDGDTSSLTSCSTANTVTTSGTGRGSAASGNVAAETTQRSPAAAAESSVTRADAPARGAEGGRVAHVEPQRHDSARTSNRRKRGRRSGQRVRERQRSSTPRDRMDVSTDTPVESTGRPAARSSPRATPASFTQSRPREQQRARDDIATEESGARRRRPHGGPSTQQQQRRIVNDVGGGALEIVSPRGANDSVTRRDGAWGDACDVTAPPSRRFDRHLYLEGAIIDHRNGNFMASVLVCGKPPTGTSNVIRRNDLERYTAVGVASGLQVSYYCTPEDYQHLSGRTLSQARCQALLINTATKLPAGCFWFWELPPTSGEWLLPSRDDAQLNPGSEHVKMRFSPLRRG